MIISKEKFINRDKELKLLRDTFKSKENSFSIIYGRRRIGKTKLIKKASEGFNRIYLFCENGYKINLKNLENIIANKYGISLKLENYKSFFEFLKKVEKERIVIIFDEFQNLVEKKNILSEFQFIIDEIIRNSKIHFVILGSAIGFMQEIMEYKSPLYGRRDLSLHLSYLSFFDSSKFFNLDLEEVIKIFGITGGVPLYLNIFNSFEDVKNICFNKYGFLYSELDFLLSSEFKESKNYRLILNSIARGKRTFNEISNDTGISKTNLSIYLDKLIKINFVEKEIPVNESLKTKKSLYFIKDNYLNFYFSFIEKYKELIEFENLNFFSSFLEEYNQYLGYIFEKISKEFLIKVLENDITKIGRWWWKDKKIDIIALNESENTLYAFEVKWKDLTLKDVKRIVFNLKEKLKYFSWKENRKENLGVIAKSLTEKSKEWLIENNYYAYDLEDFKKVIN